MNQRKMFDDEIQELTGAHSRAIEKLKKVHGDERQRLEQQVAGEERRVGEVERDAAPEVALDRVEGLVQARVAALPGEHPRDHRGGQREGRPHRHRDAVDLRPSDAVQSGVGLPAADNQEASSEVDRPRTAVVPGG